MPMLIDLNAAKFRDPWRQTPLAVGLLYFFAFGRRSPQFYKVGLVHQSRDWRNLWYMLDGRRTAHMRSFGANSKLLRDESFVFVSPNHGFLWHTERQIKEYLRNENARARPSGDSGYTETFLAARLADTLEIVDEVKRDFLEGRAPARFSPPRRRERGALISTPLTLDQIRPLLLVPTTAVLTVTAYLKVLRTFSRLN